MKTLKYYKHLSLLVLVVSLSIFTIPTFASTKTITKSNDLVVVKLKYTSYQDSQGRKLVKDGKIVSVQGKRSPIYLWEYSPVKYSLSRIDGGRTYKVSITGNHFTNTITGGQHSYTETTSLEFSYVK